MIPFNELLAEGASVPVDGWDFSWFEGRATEERPSWGYSRLLAERMSHSQSALDVQTGGGEVLATIPHPPRSLHATESWLPNVELAEKNLAHLGVVIHRVPDAADLPFPNEAFDLVTSRHPTGVRWTEIARVLCKGGTYLSQQVGAGSVRDLTEFMMGPQPVDESRSAERAATAATRAGLEVIDLRQEALRMTFNDIGAVAVFLRKVIWIVPGFTVESYREKLAELHVKIQFEGPFTAYAHRFLIEAVKPY